MRTGAVAMVFGTRPELVKLAPLLWEIGQTAHTIHTGQHRLETLAETAAALGVEQPTISCGIVQSPRGRQIGEAVTSVTEALVGARPEVVLVQGDTNSALAGALAATSLDIPLVHVEAGLRAFDRDLPEERNRVVIDHLADLGCAPTETARENLRREGIAEERIVVTGNTVVDAARRCLPPPAERAAVLDRFGLTSAAYVLATMHRPENVDDPIPLRTVIDELSRLPLPVIFPAHPRTVDRARDAGLDLAGGSIRLIEPVDYLEFLALEAECALIVTDSGGVQEEASIVGRPTIVVRRSTERPEGLGTVSTLVNVGPDIGTAVRGVLAELSSTHRRLAVMGSPYGDGHAAPRIVAAVEALLT